MSTASVAGRRVDFYGVAFTSIDTDTQNIGTGSASVLTAGATQRVEIVVQNIDAANAIYVGNSGVTTANGYRIPAGEERAFAITADIDLYAIAETATVEVRVAELR